jgi:hypothetical protein
MGHGVREFHEGVSAHVYRTDMHMGLRYSKQGTDPKICYTIRTLNYYLDSSIILGAKVPQST